MTIHILSDPIKKGTFTYSDSNPRDSRNLSFFIFTASWPRVFTIFFLHGYYLYTKEHNDTYDDKTR
jgi:hypothetical protein